MACAILFAAILGGCSNIMEDTKPPGVFDQVRAIDLSPKPAPPVTQPQQIPDDRKAVEYLATSAAPPVADTSEVGAVAPGATRGGSDGYDLNFENTPITTVTKVVLGDILGIGFVIDPRVQGTISLSSARPVPRADLIYVLESALKANNVALVKDPAGYRLVPLSEAAGTGGTDVGTSRPEPGYGVSVVPLRYVSADALMPLIDSFATKGGMVKADPGRNVLLIQGTAGERQAAINTALSFDADWMRGQSVGIYPVRNSTPEPIISELETLLDAGEAGLSHKLVKFQAIGRLNSIMVVARKPELLQTAATWIGRLDRSDTTVGVRVYRLRYGEARQMAKVLNELFIGGSAGLDQAASQIAPGSGASAASSGGSDGGSSSGSGSGLSVQQRLGLQPPSQPQGGGGGGGKAGDGDGAPAGPASGGGGTGGGGALLAGVRITADAVNNSLLIYASQENYRVIERTLLQLDQPQLQVAIEATVAEVTLNDKLAYGVQFYLTSKDLGLGRNNGSVLNTLSSDITDQAINRVLPGFNLLVGRENQPRAILDALHTVTDVKVLSNPSVVVVDNQKATLQVGDEVPVSTGSATVLSSSNTVVNTIEYKNTGIILHVTPRVNVNGQVRLDVEQEISNVTQSATTSSGGSAGTNSSGTLTPTVSQRKVKSTIAVASGQTVLLAGLINERSEGVRQGVPVLDQIPGVGDAFAHRDTTVRRTELIIFIRPQIIRDNMDAHTVAEELRAKLKGTVGVLPGGPQPLINR